MEDLDELSIRVLAFERDWIGGEGAKEAAVRAQFGLSTTRYYQLLYALADSPSALRHDPLLVRRLQRLRETRSLARRMRDQRSAG